MKEFILSFIVPKKIERHRDMNLFISVMLFIFSFVICCSIPTFRISPIVKENYLSECLVYEGTYQSELVNKVELPKLDIKDNLANYVNVDQVTEHVYDLVYKTEDGKEINLKIVYELDKEKDQELTHINLNEYLNINPFNEDKSLKSQDLLVVYTREAFYYIYNHGYSIDYMNSNADKKVEEYNYLYAEEWAETKHWSLYKADKSNLDDNGFYDYRDYYFLPAFEERTEIDPNTNEEVMIKVPLDDLQNPNTWSSESFDSEKYVEYNGIKYYGYRKITNNIYDIFHYGVTTNIGVFTYDEMNKYGVDYFNNNDPLTEFSDVFVSMYGEAMRSYNYQNGLIYVIVLPLLWILAIYLIMHKNGELTRFREYYSVGAVAILLPSIAISIVGMFVPYYRFASIYMIVHAGYYLFVISRINKLSKNNNKEKGHKIEKDVVDVEEIDYSVETKPASEYNTNNNFQKPSQVE